MEAERAKDEFVVLEVKASCFGSDGLVGGVGGEEIGYGALKVVVWGVGGEEVGEALDVDLAGEV